MKALFWANLPVNKIAGTIWEKLDDTKININKDSLELKFSQKSKTEKKPETKKEITKNKKLSLLQPDTIRKINIVLNKLKFSTTDIPDLIETMDTNKLTTNVCELLIQIMPTTEEVKLVTNYDGKEEISINDEMVIMISSIPGYTERLEAIIFDNSYESDCEIIEEEVDKFFKAFDFLKNSKKFKQWLKIIMAFGNYMNGGTFRGGVYAFKLNALNKLTSIKSKDNSKTLLLYIITFIYEQLDDPSLMEILDDLTIFNELQYQSIKESLKELNDDWKKVVKLKKIVEDAKKNNLLEEDDKVEEYLNDFYDKAEKTITELNTKSDKIDEKFKEIVKFYAEDDKMTLDELIAIFRQFYRDLKENNEKYKDLKRKQEEEKKKNTKRSVLLN
jgi:hypothetical protein